jgi:hypothetical protein
MPALLVQLFQLFWAWARTPFSKTHNVATVRKALFFKRGTKVLSVRRGFVPSRQAAEAAGQNEVASSVARDTTGDLWVGSWCSLVH